ncbi:archease [candidate division KSB1 bacterium]
MSKKFEVLDHTADIGLEFSAGTIEELFEIAAIGMFSIITDPGSTSTTEKIRIELSSSAHDLLLVEWLNELLYISETKKLFFSKFNIECKSSTDGVNIVSICEGEKISTIKHRFLTEIKTATYHQLFIKQSESGWKGRVIFDI